MVRTSNLKYKISLKYDFRVSFECLRSAGPHLRLSLHSIDFDLGENDLLGYSHDSYSVKISYVLSSLNFQFSFELYAFIINFYSCTRYNLCSMSNILFFVQCRNLIVRLVRNT